MANIVAERRDGTGKGVARQLRREGRIPAVLYGKGMPALSISLELQAWRRILETEASTIRTQPQQFTLVGGSRQLVLLRDMQVHPVTGIPQHVDLMRFDPEREIEIEVPVHLLDEDQCPGVKRGGMMQQIRHELEVKCKAGDIPESIDISVAELDIGDAIHLSDVKLPEGVEVHSDADFTIATVVGVKDESVESEDADESAAADSSAEV